MNADFSLPLHKPFIPPRRRFLPDKYPWTHSEDQKLTELVETFGSKHWSTIAIRMSNRTGKQCRERWTHHLDPAVNRANWSLKEEWMLFLQHKIYGNKWALLVKKLPGRTDNSVKNHWNSKMKKKLGFYMQRLADALNLAESDGNKFEENFSASEKELIVKISKIPRNELYLDHSEQQTRYRQKLNQAEDASPEISHSTQFDAQNNASLKSSKQIPSILSPAFPIKQICGFQSAAKYKSQRESTFLESPSTRLRSQQMCHASVVYPQSVSESPVSPFVNRELDYKLLANDYQPGFVRTQSFCLKIEGQTTNGVKIVNDNDVFGVFSHLQRMAFRQMCIDQSL